MNMDNQGSFILYTTPDGESKIEVTLHNETVWLSLDQMAELFQRNKSTVSRHIKNVFEEGELQPDSTVAFFATVQTEGKRKVERDIAYYNLEILTHAGRISAKLAKEKADAEYEKFKERTQNELTPVEIHFIENFEREQKRITDNRKK